MNFKLRHYPQYDSLNLRNIRLEAELAAERTRREEADWKLRTMWDAGHNDDCLFCGFKDKQIKEYLAKYEPGDIRLQPKETAQDSTDGESQHLTNK